nr:TcpQ domain-containing protein [Cronobacter turicensis]
MSLNDRAGLFPVLLLTGCAPHVITTGPPSGSVVDSMLSRSAADISAMQYRVHQSGPAAKRPVSATAKPLAKPLPVKPLASASLLKVSSTSNATMLTGQGPAGGFISRDGAAPTLRSALAQIAPAGTSIAFDKTVHPDAPELWSWKGNDRWQNVADKMLVKRGLKATLNPKTKILLIEPVQRAQGTNAGQTATSVAMTLPAANLLMAGTQKTMPLPTSGRDPFKGSSPVAHLPVTPPVRIKPVEAKPVLRTWQIERGSTLRQGYEQWASQELCPPGKPKWTVRWDTSTNYPIDYTLTFKAANFEEATAKLFDLWHRAQVPLFVSGYRQQCLIVVSDVPPGSSSAHPQQE